MARRSFYKDEEDVVTKPGVNAEIRLDLKEAESAHGNITFVEGMGVRTTPYLEKYANNLRHFVHGNLHVLEAELATQKTALCNEWQILKHKVDRLVVDPVFPNVVDFVLPILVTNLAVSRRAFPLRFLASSVATGVSLKFAMPKTYAVVKGDLLSIEKDSFPEFRHQRIIILDSLKGYMAEALQMGQQSKLDLQRQIHDARQYVVKFLSDE